MLAGVPIRYATPADWGMTWARPPEPEARPDPEAYIHHAGGAAWMHDDAFTVFRQLNTYAQQGKGYSAVDYDILVHYSRGQDLLTIAGARQEWMSAATRDRNELGEAICLCADTEEREPLPIEVEGLARAVVYGIEKGWIARDATILGHRDNPAHLNATQCPGRYLYPHLPAIRARVAQLLAPPPTGDHVLLYKVESGDSYWAICRKVHADGKVTTERLAALQAANSNAALRPDQLINIPGRVT